MLILRCPSADIQPVKKSEPIYIVKGRQLEAKLNHVKSKITPIFLNDKDGYTTATRLLDRYAPLKKILEKEYGAQYVTNAWIKLFELAVMFHLGNSKTQDELVSVHLCEAPGAFISAMNHYLKTCTRIRNWKWIAQSLVKANEKTYKKILAKKVDVSELKALDDSYGLIKKYPNNWDFGNGTGDITSTKNMVYYKNLEINADLVTSDVGLSMESIKIKGSEDEAFNKQEEMLCVLNASQIITGLHVLRQGGDCVFKTFTCFYPLTVSLVYLLCSCFEKIWMVKPVASRPANSEIYLVGKGFIGLPDDYLYELREQIHQLDINCSIIENIPSSFYNDIMNLQKVFMLRQVASIEQNLRIYEAYKKDIKTTTQNQNECSLSKSREWIKRYRIQGLFQKNKL